MHQINALHFQRIQLQSKASKKATEHRIFAILSGMRVKFRCFYLFLTSFIPDKICIFASAAFTADIAGIPAKG